MDGLGSCCLRLELLCLPSLCFLVTRLVVFGQAFTHYYRYISWPRRLVPGWFTFSCEVMIVKSLVATILSLPVTIILIGLFLVLIPAPSLHLASLLMVFPIWVVTSCAVYQIPRSSHAALLMVTVIGLGYLLIVLLKQTGLSALWSQEPSKHFWRCILGQD